jgi:hypothetical protein
MTSLDVLEKGKTYFPCWNSNSGPSRGYPRPHTDRVVVLNLCSGASSCFEWKNYYINPLTPNDLQRLRSVNPLKIKIPNKNMREKPTNTSTIHLVY